VLVKLIKIIQTGNNYSLKEIFVNPKQISYLLEDEIMKEKLLEGTVSINLHQSTSFTKIRLDNSGLREEFTVIGDPYLIEQKIKKTIREDRRQLLRD